jgi:SAM-dependent methyltransferase
MPYPDVPNPDLLDRVPLTARVVMDVGCASGSLGQAYKRRNPMARVIGLEFDTAAAKVAATRLDRVHVTDLDSSPLPFAAEQPAGSIDCIVYGDVLEHLRDPWTVLRRQVDFLSEDGTVLVCMPNAEHWTFVERLLRGVWDYEDIGLFDRTHLRWFSKDTTRHALTSAGLEIVDVIPRTFGYDASEAFADAIAPALRRLGVDSEDYLRRAAPIQYVWRARRRPTVQLHLVSTMLHPVGGVSHVRVLEPLKALESDPSLVATVIAGSAAPPPEVSEPRLFIFHRPLLAGEAGLARIRGLLTDDWLVLCEFDDHPDYIPVLQRPDIQNFRAVHAIQTSTEPLADVLRAQNPEVAVFPNAVAELPDAVNYATPNSLTLFFAGMNRENEWPPYIDALNAVAARAGPRLKFRIVADNGLFEALQTPHKAFVPLCDYNTYRSMLAQCEISFMPLLDTPFNRCKSDLKFLEAAAHRVTALASTVVYPGSIVDGRTGLLFATAAELERQLMTLVMDPSSGRRIAEEARTYVIRNRMLAYQVARRSAWYHSLWARREELRRALLARVPELL